MLAPNGPVDLLLNNALPVLDFFSNNKQMLGFDIICPSLLEMVFSTNNFGL